MKKANNIMLVYLAVAFIIIVAVSQILVYSSLPQMPSKITSRMGTVNLCYNHAPDMYPVPNMSVDASDTLLYYVNATDPDGGTISFSADILISNITTVNSSKGLINFTPSSSQVGNYSISITATDDSGCSNDKDTESFNLEIIWANTAPYLISNIPNFEWYQGGGITNAFDLDNYFADPDNDTLFYTVTDNRNVNITIDSQNRVSFSTAALPWWYGEEKVRFVANDSYLTNTSNLVTLTIRQLPPSPPVHVPSVGGGAAGMACRENWSCYPWLKCMPTGIRVRRCIDTRNCGTEFFKPKTQELCVYEPTCADNVQNRDESDVDCGGKICLRCEDGKKCNTDEDCINKCHPVEKICYTPPVERLPISLPAEKIYFPLLRKLLVVIALALVLYILYKIYKRYIAPRIKEFKKKKELLIIKRLLEIRKIQFTALEKLAELRNMVAVTEIEVSLRTIAVITKEYISNTFNICYEFDFGGLCRDLKQFKLPRCLYEQITSFFSRLNIIKFAGLKIGIGGICELIKDSEELIRNINNYLCMKEKSKQIKETKKGSFRTFIEFIKSKLPLAIIIILACSGFYVVNYSLTSYVSYEITEKPIVDNNGNLTLTTCIEDQSCTYNFSLNVTHSDKDRLNYSYAAGDEFNGFSMNRSTGIVTITFTNDNQSANYTVRLVVTDPVDGLADVGSKPFELRAVNDVPVLNWSYQHIEENESFYKNLTLATTDEENDIPFNFTDNSTLFNISEGSIINFTPRFEDAGVYYVNITVNDSRGAENSTVVILNITAVNTNPALDYVCDNERNATFNLSFNCKINATDRENTELTFSANYSWFIINNSWGTGIEALANFTPNKTAAGNWYVNITASDGYGGSDSRAIGFNVSNINVPPVITNPGQINATQGFMLTYYINVTDEDLYTQAGENLTFYSNATQFNITKSCQQYICYGIINFTPTQNDVGNISVNFTVADDENASDTAIFNLSFILNSPPTIDMIYPYGKPVSDTTVFNFTNASLFSNNITTIELQENNSYTFEQNSSDADNNTLSYYWYVNSVLNSTSSSLNQSYGFYSAGTYNITLFVSDGNMTNGYKSSFTWNATVSNVNRLSLFGILVHSNMTDFSGTNNQTNTTRQPGNITLEWNGTAYSLNGTYISQVIDFGTPQKDIELDNDTIKLFNISWTAVIPENTSLVVQTKTGGNNISFTEWQNHTNANNSAISANGRYMQYKLLFYTNDSSVSPVIENITITYGINDLTINENQNENDWIDLDYFFKQDDDTDDTVSYNHTNISGVVLTIDSNHVVDVAPDTGATGTRTFKFYAYDGHNYSYSNEITISIVQIVYPTTTTIISGGGGGGGGRTIIKKEEKPIEMIRVHPLEIKLATILIPLTIRNPTTRTLFGIRMSAESDLEGITFAFSLDYLDSLLPEAEAEISLNVAFAPKAEGGLSPGTASKEFDKEFTITIKANATDASDVVVVSVNPAANATIRFVRDLLSSNPECLELNELLKDAEQLISRGSLKEAQNLLDKIVESCRYLMASKEKMVEKPTPMSKAWIKRNLIIILAVALISIVFLISYYIIYRRSNATSDNMPVSQTAP